MPQPLAIFLTSKFSCFCCSLPSYHKFSISLSLSLSLSLFCSGENVVGVYYERIIDTKSHSAPGQVLHSAAEAFRLKKKSRQKMSQSRKEECRNRSENMRRRDNNYSLPFKYVNVVVCL